MAHECRDQSRYDRAASCTPYVWRSVSFAPSAAAGAKCRVVQRHALPLATDDTPPIGRDANEYRAVMACQSIAARFADAILLADPGA